MGHEGMKAGSPVSREVIADSIEVMIIAHRYDAIVGIAGCDKSLPGTLMGMARVNMPFIFLYGGTILQQDRIIATLQYRMFMKQLGHTK